MDFLVVLAIGFVVYLVAGYGRSVREAEAAKIASQAVEAHAEEENWCEAVGENQHQKELQKIVGSSAKSPLLHECQAELRPDNEDTIDRNAVAVYIDQTKVAKLSRSHAIKYRQLSNPPQKLQAAIMRKYHGEALSVRLKDAPWNEA